MQDKLIRNLRTGNIWVLVGLSSLISLLLANVLNWIFSIISQVPLTPRLILFSSIDAILIPLLIGPPILILFRRASDLSEANHLLEREISERKLAEQEAHQRAVNLAMINDLAVECSTLSAGVDISRRIAEKLRDITQAFSVCVTTYDAARQVLVLQHIAMRGESDVLDRASALFGSSFIGLESPVRQQDLDVMLKCVTYTTSDLNEVTFGAVPKPVALALRAAFGLGSFTPLAFISNGELTGTAVLISRAGEIPVEHATAVVISRLIAVTMQRHAAEEKLHKRESRLRLITDNMVDIVCQVDGNHRLIYVSPSVTRMLGYSINELLGRQVFEFLHPDEAGTIRDKLNAAFAEHETNMRQELRARRKDGSDLWIEVSARLMFDSGDTFRGSVFVLRDIAERKLAESDRQKLIIDLEAKNNELEQFTYTVSHDLRSPLVTIQGFLSYVQKDLDAGNFERARSDIQYILSATNKMNRLLSDLLELSRVGRAMNAPKPLPFEAVVQDAAELVRGRLEERGVRLEIDPNLPVVIGDPLRLVQVMQNLLDNAVKFMGNQPQPLVKVGVLENGGLNGLVTLYVRDNGTGIAPQNHEKVFDLFHKLDQNDDGTGIGLTLVRRIIEIHGGRIWVESAGAGEGACFFFSLPTGLME